MMKREKPTTKNTLVGKAFLRFDGEITSFTNKQKLKEFSTTKPALQEMLQETSLSKRRKPEIRNTKIARKNSLVKANMQERQ